MRKVIVAALIALMAAAAACRSKVSVATSGTPDPPFEGDLPQEVYVYKGETGVYGGQIVLDLPSDITTLNIMRATDTLTTYVLWYHVYRCLVDFRNGDDPPTYDPGLCTGWEVSPDSKQWTFYLRKGVRWSDGEPFTADDVLFTYDVTLDERIQDIAIRDAFIEEKDAGGKATYPALVKLDDYTVRFDLHKPNGGFLDQIFNLFLIPKHKWEQAWRDGTFAEKMKTSDDPADIVVLGPYRIKESVIGQRIVLERNPYFWKVDSKGQRLPYLDRVIFVIAKDANTVQAKFEAGELDVMQRVRAQEFALVKRLEGPDVKVEDIGISFDTQWLALNQNTGTNPKTGKPFVEPWKQRLFRNLKFRQAISYAIDREGIANTIYAGRAVPLYSFVSPSDKLWYSDDIMKYTYDKEKARQLLAEMGLKDTNGDGYLEDGEGHTVEINIFTNSGNSQRVSTVGFIIKSLQDVGIKANSNPVALTTISEMMQTKYNFDAIVLGWGSGVPPGPTNAKNIIYSSGLQHVCFPRQKTPSTDWEARADQLMAQIEPTSDMAERKRLYAEIQRIWSEQLPEINLVAQKEAVAYRTKFGNIRPAPLPPRATWNIEEIYLRQ